MAKRECIRTSLVHNTTMNIKQIATKLNEGQEVDRAKLTELIDCMLRFLHDTIKPKDGDDEQQNAS